MNCTQLSQTVKEATTFFSMLGKNSHGDALNDVSNYLKQKGVKRDGVIWRMTRLEWQDTVVVTFSAVCGIIKKYYRELVYFSFYIIANKTHEREIENVVLRAAGPQMILNQRKVRDGIDPGSVGDYEPGTKFFRRRYARDAKHAVKLTRGRRTRRLS